MYIWYNGRSSEELGLIIESFPAAQRGARRYTSQTFYGRDGSIYIDEAAYDDYEAKVVINCFGSAEPRDVYAWLNGSGWMTTSDAPDRKRWVRWYEAQSAKRWRTDGVYDSVTMSGIFEPFQYNLSEAPIAVSSGESIPGRGDWYACPLITLTGRGDVLLRIGDAQILYEIGSTVKTVYLDTDARIAYTQAADGTKTSAALSGIDITLTSDDPAIRWGRLEYNAPTPISWTGSASVQILPRWRWF